MKKLYFIAILLILGCKSQKISTKEQADNIESTLSTKSTSIFDVQDTLIVPHICAKSGIYKSYEFKYKSWIGLIVGGEEFYMGGFYTDFLDCLMRAIDKGDEDAKKILWDMTYRIHNDIPNFPAGEAFDRLRAFRYDYIDKLPKKDNFHFYKRMSELDILTPTGYNISKAYVYSIVKYFQKDVDVLKDYLKYSDYKSKDWMYNKLQSDIKSGIIKLDTSGYIDYSYFPSAYELRRQN